MANITLLGLTEVTPSNKGSIEIRNTSAVDICLVVGNPALNSLKSGDMSFGQYIGVFFVAPGASKSAVTPSKDYATHKDTQKIFACPMGASSAVVDVTEFVDTRDVKVYG